MLDDIRMYGTRDPATRMALVRHSFMDPTIRHYIGEMYMYDQLHK